jgi:thiamine pyrophosphokinase
MHCLIVANGPMVDIPPFRAALSAARLLIAADGGGNALLDAQIEPHVVIGDLDSLGEETLTHFQTKGVEIIRYPAEKDETDLELALLLALQRGATSIDVLGALGGRWDHTLSNVALLAMPELAHVVVRLLEADQEIVLVRQEATIVGQVGDTVSLMPLCGDAHGITLSGCAYPLNGETLSCTRSRGISNVLREPVARLRLQQGMLLVVHKRWEDQPANTR